MKGKGKRKSKRPVGRPTDFTPALGERLLREVRQGSVVRACRKLGVAQSAFYDWVVRGEHGEAKFAEFAESYLKAKDERIHALEEDVVEHGDAGVKLKLLANIHPKRHSAQLRVHVTSQFESALNRLERAFPDGGPMLTSEQAREIALRAVAGSAESDDEESAGDALRPGDTER